MTEVQIQGPRNFAFDRTVRSHGWFDLRPFAYDREARTLTFAFERAGAAVAVSVRAGTRGRLVAVTNARGAAATRQVQAIVRSVLRLDEDLSPVRDALAGAPLLIAAVDAGGGRLLRAPTVFEDVVKMLCTTNCSWGLTHVMVERLVDKAGISGPGGARAFPSAAALAKRPVSFFRDEVRAGYRAPFLKELATRVARGELDLESLREPATSSDDAAKVLRTIKGIGPYAADNLLRLLGHYDYLGLDSWCRARFRKLYPRAAKGKGGLDAAIARRYHRHAPYQGLAMWLDLTRSWHEPQADWP
jgi:N-glycosylase/DNA lyase